ncbi:group III truncated hemoglobin [Aurantibacter crassamenti]|uniref:group III truncated hemoglobin n=1 Tax=Aurantibacter crassamenti TaxID=1837375 RepID=UPI00193A8432|nr:group III truncated hemoglobin [Aurantibacter crassamenti]MBM1106869.1 group III truncated hemoglobin [Aurantibacter crassamenti]
MSKSEITNKSEVFQLVDTFYNKVRADELIGPIFNGIINDWDHHLEHLTTFWSNQLFIERGTYKGDPISAHIKVDDFAKNQINEQHFGRWLNLWVQTIDELFEGDNAFILKNRARKMSTHIHLSIFSAREN